MSKVTVNGKQSWSMTIKDGEIMIDGVKTGSRVEALSQGRLLVRPDGGSKQHQVELIHLDRETNEITVSVGGTKYTVSVKSDLDLLLEKMGMGPGSSAVQSKVKAPMPGLVIDVLVSVGQEVVKDEPLLILEAMKMENVIKAPRDGAIKSVGVEKGNAIEKNTLLVEFDR